MNKICFFFIVKVYLVIISYFFKNFNNMENVYDIMLNLKRWNIKLYMFYVVSFIVFYMEIYFECMYTCI